MSDVLVPTVTDELAKLIERQSSTDRQPPAPVKDHECVVSGWLLTSLADAVSLEWDPWAPCSVVELHLLLDTADEGVAVELRRDGNVVATVTAGGTSNPQRLGLQRLTDPIAYSPGQKLQFALSSAGTNAWSSFIVQARIRSARAMSGAIPLIPDEGIIT